MKFKYVFKVKMTSCKSTNCSEYKFTTFYEKDSTTKYSDPLKARSDTTQSCVKYEPNESPIFEQRVDYTNKTSYYPDGIHIEYPPAINVAYINISPINSIKNNIYFYLKGLYTVGDTDNGNYYGLSASPPPYISTVPITLDKKYTILNNPIKINLNLGGYFNARGSPTTWKYILTNMAESIINPPNGSSTSCSNKSVSDVRFKIDPVLTQAKYDGNTLNIYYTIYSTCPEKKDGYTISDLKNTKILIDLNSLIYEKIDMNNKIELPYENINLYNGNATSYSINLKDSTYKNVITSDPYMCNIELPQIHPFEQPTNTVDTGILARWSVSGDTDNQTLTMTLIGGSWWSDDKFGVKARRLSMLKLLTSSSLTPYNLITNTIDKSIYVAPMGSYYKDWFKPNVMGNAPVGIPASMNPYITIDVHIKIEKDDLLKILTGTSTSGYKLIIGSITSLALLDAKNIFAQEAYSILNPSSTQNPSNTLKYGIYYTSLSSIKKYTDTLFTLSSSQITHVNVYSINMNDDSLSISYNKQNIEDSIYTFTYKNYIDQQDGRLLNTTYKSNITTKLNDMFANKYYIPKPIDIILTKVTLPPDSNKIPVQLQNYYTDIIIQATGRYPITKYDNQDNNQGNNVFKSDYPKKSDYNTLKYDHFYKNDDDNSLITNVFLSKEETDEQLDGSLTYGDIYKLVDEWMKGFQTNSSIPITYLHLGKSYGRPIHSSNIQFYNQPSGCPKGTSNIKNSNWKNCCNFTTIDSIYNCDGFANSDPCSASGPSAVAIYNRYMMQYNIGCVVGKPLVPKAAPAGGEVKLTSTDTLIDTTKWHLLDAAKKNGQNIYPETNGGAIMTWAIADYLNYTPSGRTSVQMNNNEQLQKRIPIDNLSKNNTILYQYCDAFGGYSEGDMINALSEIINGYTDTNNICWIVPILSFCDIGTDSTYVRMSTTSDAITEWWSTDKFTYLNNYYKYGTLSGTLSSGTPPRNPYNLADPIIGPINGMGNYVVMKNGAVGQWVNIPPVNNANNIITTLGKPTNNMAGVPINGEYSNGIPIRKTKILLSFGGQNVSLFNTSILNTEIIAQHLVNLVVKYAFDGIDFDLEGFSRKPSDIIWVTSLYGNVKKHFLGLEALIKEDNTNNTPSVLGYPAEYTFMITDAPQPAYFTPEYWGNVGAKNPFSKGTKHCNTCTDSSSGCT